MDPVEQSVSNAAADPVPPRASKKKNELISVITLGCPKNLVDSESMLGQLHRAGFQVAADVEDAALVVVNTCAFLTSSQEESIETILEVSGLKERGKLQKLIVAGCLAQRHGNQLLDEMDEVDYLVGTGAVDQIAAVARGLLDGSLGRGARLDGLDRADFEWEPRVLSGLQHTAYLKISEGCNNTCTFCIIPQLRGKHRSRSIEDLVREAERLARGGVQELVIIGQDTTSYGLDLYGKFALDRLLEALDQVEGIRWIRLLYTYPRYWTDGLLESFARCEKLLPYVDMPIQHADEQVLRRMRRGLGWNDTYALLHRIRAAAPEMVIRTTVITGFPGETDEEFENLLTVVRDFEFDHLGAFAYSTEEGTPAGAMEGQVPEEIREERRGRLLAEQRRISWRKNRQRIGQSLEVLIDRVEDERALVHARWKGQAPEIDGGVFVKVSPDEARPRPGDRCQVKILGAGPYDLVATMREGEVRQWDV